MIAGVYWGVHASSVLHSASCRMFRAGTTSCFRQDAENCRLEAGAPIPIGDAGPQDRSRGSERPTVAAVTSNFSPPPNEKWFRLLSSGRGDRARLFPDKLGPSSANSPHALLALARAFAH